MAYSLIGILALILSIIVNFDVFFFRKSRGWRTLRSYRLFLYAIAIFFIVDICWGFLDEAGLYYAAYVDTAFYYIAMAGSVLAWTYFAVSYTQERNAIGRVILATGCLVFLGVTVCVIINFFQPILFSYDVNVYTPTIGRHIFLGSQMLMFAITLVRSIVRAAKNKGPTRSSYVAMIVFGAVACAALGFQMAFPLAPFFAIGCSIGMTIVRGFVLLNENSEYRQALEETTQRENEQQKELGFAKKLAYTDPLTGVKNKHAYVEDEEFYDRKIRDGEMEEFAMIVFDLNDLKLINDTKGHDTGDAQIVQSTKLIREFFPNVPIYRYGGDEFTVMLFGEAYRTRHESLQAFDARILQDIGTDQPVVATGLADFRKGVDNTLSAVFARADEAMYWHKRKLKQNTNAKYGTRGDIYDMFYRSKDCSLIDMLNNSSCDELVEVDLKHNTFRVFYHIDGKYIGTPPNLTFEQLYEFCCNDLVHPEDREEYARQLNPDRFFQRLAKSKIPNFDFIHVRFKLQDGTYRYVEQCVIAGEENELAEDIFRIYIFDIHNLKVRMEGKESNQEGSFEKERNFLTGLLNESFFFARAESLVRAKKGISWCLVSIDIEHFRFFDEWYGRDAGDELLKTIGQILLEEDAKVGGLSGYFTFDDFAIVCPFDEDQIAALYERIRAVVVSFGLSVGFLPAFGVAHIEHDTRVVDAFDQANIALDRAKKDIRHRISIYDPRLRDADETDYRILSEFVEGMKRDEFTFYIQPQCVISSGKIVGSEALARWIKVSGRIVSPADYIPIIERYGFIMDLDQLLWEKVVKWLRSLLDRGIKPLPISLNVSRADIFTLDIGEVFHELAEKYNVPHNLIKIEITESAYTETDSQISELVKTLRKDGFMVMMDDFGSGYSSLNMLNTIDVDVIKVDAGFLRLNGSAYERGIRIIESVVNMAKNISMPMIIEGVETKSQSDFLQGLGCRYAQGFYFYRPMPIHDYEALLQDDSKLDRRGIRVKINEQFRLREFLDKNIYSDSMLNNIIGAVAFYALHENGDVDIVRFNEQFYETVGDNEFHDRLLAIQRYMPEEERSMLVGALKKAIDDVLSGAVAVLRFMKHDGTITHFRIHFYHIGKRDNAELFYGSALNVSEYANLRDELRLVSRYSSDSLVLVSRIENKWVYRVASNGLANVLDLTPEKLEEELNNGEFAKKVLNREELKDFMQRAKVYAEEKKNFQQTFLVRSGVGKTLGVHLQFIYVGNESDNVLYVMRASAENGVSA